MIYGTWRSRHPTSWKLSRAIARAGTAFVSTGSGVSASGGTRVKPRMSRSSTTTEARGFVMAAKKLRLTHPGKILREEFMEQVGLSAYALAKALDVPLPRVNDIVREKR